MRKQSVLTVLLIAALGMTLIASSALGQPPPAPAPQAPTADGLPKDLPVPSARALAPMPAEEAGVMRAGNNVAIDDFCFVPPPPKIPEKEIAGLPRQAPAEPLTWRRVYELALVRARSGGSSRAERLDPQALAERARRHGVADFARFRKEFLAGRTEAGAAFHDPSGAYFKILKRLQAIDVADRHNQTFENLQKLLQELIQGESAGLSQLDVDLVNEARMRVRRALDREIAGFRDELDEMKVALGLSPHAAVYPDRRELAGFDAVWESVKIWFRRPDRRLSELPRIMGRLPAPGDVIVDGRPILGAIDPGPARNPDRIEEILGEATRLAFKDRPGVEKPGAPTDADVSLELKVRRRIRHLLDLRYEYEAQKRSYELAIRLQDQAFERSISPTSAGTPPARTPMLREVIEGMARGREAEDGLVATWLDFRSERLALYRDLGALPYDNWDAFLADLAARADRKD